jgi:colicin import membrane protein
MNVSDYVSGLGHRLAAKVTALALTDTRVQTAAEVLAIARYEIGPEALGVASLALQLYGPELGPTDPDRVGQETYESGRGEHLEAANGLLDLCVRGFEPSGVEGPVPEWLLQQQREAALAQEQEHAKQQAALDDQLKQAREAFDERHRDDSAEEMQRDREKLDEAERALRTDLDGRQNAEREARETAERVAQDAFEREQAQIEEREAMESAAQLAREQAEAEARKAAEDRARQADEERER